MFFGKRAFGCRTISMKNAEVELENDPSIQVIDVRTPDEYLRGHIPGCLNVPVDRIGEITKVVPDRDAKLFVYCLSGSRSAFACDAFVRLGYGNVTNIGGIAQWNGAIETTAGVRGS